MVVFFVIKLVVSFVSESAAFAKSVEILAVDCCRVSVLHCEWFTHCECCLLELLRVMVSGLTKFPCHAVHNEVADLLSHCWAARCFEGVVFG